MFTDTHCHLSKDDYENVDEIIERAKENNVDRLIICGCDKKGIVEALEIANNYPNVYLELGFHPSETSTTTDEDINWLKELIKSNNKVVAIGEIGLDYYWEKDNKEEQKKLFIKQIELSKELNLPVVIHSRDSFQDTYDILKEANVKGDIHCFSGSLENAKRYTSLGFFLGIGGVLTFKNTNLRDTLKEIPMEYILLETDSPYLAPVPFRGEQNEPKNVKIVAETLSNIKEITLEEVSKITENNIKRLFNI